MITHKIFIMGSKDCTYKHIQLAMQKCNIDIPSITHVISGGTKNFFFNSELWAKHNNKVIIKHSPKFSITPWGVIKPPNNWIDACKQRLHLCIEEADHILFLLGYAPSPSMEYVYANYNNKIITAFEVHKEIEV